MENFLTHIHINKIFHLENIDIPIDEKEMKHLIITGKNGSGKTSVLNALVDFFQEMKDNSYLQFLYYEGSINQIKNTLKNYIISNANPALILEAENKIKSFQKKSNSDAGKILSYFNNIDNIFKEVKNLNFLFAFYAANRKTNIITPKNPEKPNLSIENEIKSSKNNEFQKFLVDLKIQEALAKNENHLSDAEIIKEWFDSFEKLLKEIFDDPNLKLEFNYKDYSFTIIQNGNRFGFNQLSDGYSAIIDIVSDLILKMQTPDSLTRFYEKEGIVLIDEIETHLHLELQRLILPFLTRVFPNIQFIVTTHSPFVINSIPNAVVFDLERKLRLENLTEYSYEALAEGYFKVNTDSSYLQNKLTRFKELAQKSNRDNAEAFEYKKLDEEFASLNEAVAPLSIKNEYLKTKLTTKP